MTGMKRQQTARAAVPPRIDGKHRASAVDSPVEPDGLDWAILRELQRDGRVPLAELGRRVGLSASSTAERIRRLEDAGVIRGYRADLDLERLGYPILAFIRVRTARADQGGVVRAIDERPEIVGCHHVTGEDCYLVRVVARSIHHLEETAHELAVLGPTTTSIVLSTLVEGRPFDRQLAGSREHDGGGRSLLDAGGSLG
jgi:Lrp/AsnC family transcriptional regulator, leucine-responsive regulatory protein